MEGPSLNSSRQQANVGPFEIERPLGAGGMAETFIAVRRGPEGFEQRVCLKRILPTLGQDPEFTRQFSSEARIAAALRHGNIVQVLDFGEQNGTYFQALELVDGLDLRGLLERVCGEGSGLSPVLVVYLGVEIANALDYAHRAVVGGQSGGVVHRDVSPSNVLLSLEGEVKLADFGIARTVQGPNHTATGVIRGKVPYMAPEYARSGKFEKSADLFSLGVLLFECLTGRRPYDGLTELETLHRAMQGEHERLAELAPEAPKELVTLIERLIHPNPEKRPESAAAVVDGLLRAVPLQNARRRLANLVRHTVKPHFDEGEAASEPGITRASDLPGRAKSADSRATASGETRTARAVPIWTAASRSLLASRMRTPLLRILWALGGVAALLVCAWGLTQIVAGFRGEAQVPHPPVFTQADSPVAHAEPVEESALKSEVFQPLDSQASSETAPVLAQGDLPETAAVRSPANALLTVVVMPYGEVHIDGRFLGAAPVTVSLRAGIHEVRVTGAALNTSRSIQLTPGEKRRLVLH